MKQLPPHQPEELYVVDFESNCIKPLGILDYLKEQTKPPKAPGLQGLLGLVSKKSSNSILDYLSERELGI